MWDAFRQARFLEGAWVPTLGWVDGLPNPPSGFYIRKVYGVVEGGSPLLSEGRDLSWNHPPSWTRDQNLGDQNIRLHEV